MDLDDLAEDLFKAVRRAARGRRRRGSDDGEGPLARWVPTAALVGGLAWFLAVGLSAVAALIVVDGAVGVAAAVAQGLLALFGLPVATWGLVRRRRAATRSRDRELDRARQAADHARIEALPKEVRGDWRRLQQARALVDELASDGWVAARAVDELDGHVAHLEKVLSADRRTRELGGRPSGVVRQQVSDLADLLVALADEAVEHQAQMASETPIPATLDEARRRLRALREARREVDDLDRRTRGSTA